MKEFIRKAKMWRDKVWRDKPPKSYLMSLLVVKAFQKARDLNHGYTPDANRYIHVHCCHMVWIYTYYMHVPGITCM